MQSDLRERLLFLINKEDWSSEEREWLLRFLETDEADTLRSVLYDAFQQSLASSLTNAEQAIAEKMLASIHARLGLENIGESRPKTKWRIGYWVAAAVLISLVAGVWFFYSNKEKKPVLTKAIKKDIAPGGNKAVLTLADGSVILLDDVVSDTLAKQGGLRVVKAADGTITYVAEGKGVEDIAMMNSISTPRGGQYRVLLSDGTEVWLNASSSIRFPVVFTGTQRVVTITGEAYFEVAKTGKPFFVQVDNRAEVLVTGTKFNINAYNDESLLRTSLIEGQVSVRKNGQSSYSALKAGEQAELGNQIRIHDDVDMEEVLAWKNGKFDFGSEMDLKAVLRQVARWYDVDIVYEGDVTGKIGGSISRNVPASKVLEMIELTGSVQCRIEDKRVVVKPVSK